MNAEEKQHTYLSLFLAHLRTWAEYERDWEGALGLRHTCFSSGRKSISQARIVPNQRHVRGDGPGAFDWWKVNLLVAGF